MAPLSGSLALGDSSIHRVTLHGEPKVSLVLMYGAGRFELTALSPSGRRLNAEHLQEEGPPVLGVFSAVELLELQNVEAGVWQIMIRAVDVPDTLDQLPYAVMLAGVTTVAILEPLIPDVATPAGRPLRAAVRIQTGGKPETGAAVTATFRHLTTDSVHSLDLLDDGRGVDAQRDDGLYTGQWAAPRQVGNYDVLFHAQRAGGPSGTSFDRVAYEMAHVSSVEASLQGPIRQVPRDEDGDGFLESVALRVTVRTSAAADFKLLCDLEGQDGKLLQASRFASLPEGEHDVDIPLEASYFTEHGLSGEAHLKEIRLFEEIDGGMMGGLCDVWNHSVELRYDQARFEGEYPVRVTRLLDCTMLDDDVDGRAEALRVEIGVFTTLAGRYQIGAQLATSGGPTIAISEHWAEFLPGENRVEFDFPGGCIRDSHSEGPLQLREILVAGPAGTILGATLDLRQSLDAATYEPGHPSEPGLNPRRPRYRCGR